jgi:Mg/Co/Ni transporter MgtE
MKMITNELEMTLSFIQTHPDAAAREMEMLPAAKAVELFQTLPLMPARKFVPYLLPLYAARLCSGLSNIEAVNLISGCNANQIASILRCLSKKQRAIFLNTLPEKKARLSKLLLSYSDDTVGAWMLADIMMLPASTSAEDALKRLAKSKNPVDFNLIPVVNEARALMGMVNVGRLLRVAGSTPVGQLIKDVSPTLQSRSSVATASKHVAWFKYDSLAVLNHSRQLVGLLRHTDLLRSLKQFEELSTVAQSSGLLSGISRAYLGSMAAIIGLVGEEIASKNKRGGL